MKSLFLLLCLIVSSNAHSDFSSMLKSLERHNAQITELKAKPQKYGLAPKGFNDIMLASERLNSVQFVCKPNRKVCSNQLARIEAK